MERRGDAEVLQNGSEKMPLLQGLNDPTPPPPPRLSYKIKLAYAVGHVLNDLCAAAWFSYTVYYFQVVMGLSPMLAGGMLMIGQIVDACATPVVGICSDKRGKRTTWHLIGTILVAVSFPLIFTPCFVCTSDIGTAVGTAVYYAIFIIMFQTGWPMVQISHLSLIPDLTENLEERSALTSIRVTFQVISSITVYIITWLVLHVTRQDGNVTDANNANNANVIDMNINMNMNNMNTENHVIDNMKNVNVTNAEMGPGNAYKFQNVAAAITCIGILASLIFQFSIRSLSPQQRQRENKEPKQSIWQSVKMLFTSIVLLQTAALYVASRLFLTCSLVYIPLFLADSYKNDTEIIALVPLVSYLSSFFVSFFVKHLNTRVGHKVGYFIGALISLAGGVWIFCGTGEEFHKGNVYGAAILLGSGNSLTLISSLCITAELIGSRTTSGASIYSVVTFADKLLNGLAVLVVEEFRCEDCLHYYRTILGIACGASAIGGALVLLTMICRPVRMEHTEINQHTRTKNVTSNQVNIPLVEQSM